MVLDFLDDSTAAEVMGHLEALCPLIMINPIKDYKNGHEPRVAHDMLIATLMSMLFCFEAWNPQTLD